MPLGDSLCSRGSIFLIGNVYPKCILPHLCGTLLSFQAWQRPKSTYIPALCLSIQPPHSSIHLTKYCCSPYILKQVWTMIYDHIITLWSLCGWSVWEETILDSRSYGIHSLQILFGSFNLLVLIQLCCVNGIFIGHQLQLSRHSTQFYWPWQLAQWHWYD